MQARLELTAHLSLQAAGITERTRSRGPLPHKASFNRCGRKGEERGEMGGRRGFSTHPIGDSHTLQRCERQWKGEALTVQEEAGRVGVPVEAGTIGKSGWDPWEQSCCGKLYLRGCPCGYLYPPGLEGRPGLLCLLWLGDEGHESPRHAEARMGSSCHPETPAFHSSPH